MKSDLELSMSCSRIFRCVDFLCGRFYACGVFVCESFVVAIMRVIFALIPFMAVAVTFSLEVCFCLQISGVVLEAILMDC